jgi:hypothetical protein
MEVSVATAGTIVAYGFFLGLGFWASKKATGYVDYKIACWEAKKLEQSLQKQAAAEAAPTQEIPCPSPNPA